MALKELYNNCAFVAGCEELPDEYYSLGRTPQESWDGLSETLKIWRDSGLIAKRIIPRLSMSNLEVII